MYQIFVPYKKKKVSPSIETINNHSLNTMSLKNDKYPVMPL
jgi:hypothetical protein